AEWLRGESAHFVVYSEGSEARLRERVDQLEDFDALLRAMTTVSEGPSPNKLHVYVVSGIGELRMVRSVPSNVAGFYTAGPSGIAVFVDGRATMGQFEILFHEYAHHFMRQHAPFPYPAWYVEGFAEYFMTAQLRDRTIDIGNFSPGRAWAIVEGQWLPVDRVLSGDLEGLNAEQRHLFYAQAWLITHYFFSTPERQAMLNRYMQAIRSGNRDGALQAATGMAAPAFQAALRRYISPGIRYRRLTLEAADTTVPMTVTRLPASAERLILREANLRVGVGDEYVPQVLQAIRAEAARHPDDSYALRVLAHAEALHGDFAVADRLLNALLRAAPNDAELLYLRGMRHLRAARDGEEWESEARQARSWFSRAYWADPNHFQSLYRYAEAMRGERDYVSENTSNVLLLAHQLAPQVEVIGMNAAVMLMNRGECEWAQRMLAPHAVNPHDPGLAARAKEMLEQARSDECRARAQRPAAAS
ncbi:MAG: tetratricopeptide repeat protein, partial [Sphingosinicella sp.]